MPLWLHNVYGHENDRPRPALAAKMLAERPDLGQGELFLACAIGDEAAVRELIHEDPTRVNRVENPWICPGCKNPLGMPPLVAVTHSALRAGSRVSRPVAALCAHPAGSRGGSESVLVA